MWAVLPTVMIRSSPCDYYLKYLVTHPDNYSDVQIRNLVKLQHLDFLGIGHLGRIRTLCTPPTPFYPEDELHHASQRFLTKERIYNLYHPDEDTVMAVKLLDHPRAKEMTEQMLFTGTEPLWISTTLKRVQFEATPRAIELYKHYYYNTDLVDGTELRAIMGMRADLDIDASDPDESRYQRYYSLASKSEIGNLQTNSSVSPFSRVLSMIRVGMMPPNMQVSRIAVAGRMAAVVRSLENTLLGKAEPARDFALTAKLLNELLESVGDASSDLQKSMMSMVLDTDASEVPSINQLTGGNHTVDLLPEQVRKEISAVAQEEAEK